MRNRTDQENFWAGDFGNDYVDRNSEPASVAHRTAWFAHIFQHTRGIRSVLELGANIGHNYLAIRNLLPGCSFTAVEINDKAAKLLEEMPIAKLHKGSIFEFEPAELGQHDLTLASGVLIHIKPELLPEVYRRLYECSTRYILINEYYNPTPVEVRYRGHEERLYKRDFAGEIMQRYPDVELVDYRFHYRGDANFPADDSTWFLMRKNGV